MQTILPQNNGNESTPDNNSNLPVIFEELEPLEIDPSSDYIFNNLYNPGNKARTQSIDLVLHNNRYYARKTILYRERRFEPTQLYNIHHKNIEHCMEFGVDEDNHYGYLYLEYMPNGNLASKITYFRENNMRLSEQPLFSNVLDLVEGLYYLHSENIIHRHIKPGNILVGRYDELVYCGFGLCCDSTDECTFKSDGCLVGTGNYWSPEIIKTKTYNFESDIFSLGCTIYELYTTNVLFPGRTLDEVQNRILYSNPNYDCVHKRIPKLEELINGMTSKNVMDRFDFNKIYKCLDEWSKMSGLNVIVRNPFIIEEMNNRQNQQHVVNNNNNNVQSTVYPFSQPVQSIQPVEPYPQSLAQSIQPVTPFSQSIYPVQPVQPFPQSLSQSIQPIHYQNPSVITPFNPQQQQNQQQPQIFNAIPISQPAVQSPPFPLQQQQQRFSQYIPNQTVIPQPPPQSDRSSSYIPPTPPPLQYRQQDNKYEGEENKEPFLQQQPSFSLPITNAGYKTIIPSPVIPKNQ